MSIIQVVVLGIVQGLTEFIPVSSSAHLVLIPHFLKWDIPPVSFDIILHLGTLIALFIFFWKDILKLFVADRKHLLLIIVACIPTVIMAIVFKRFFESLFENPLGVSVLLLVTGLLLWISPRNKNQEQGNRVPVSITDSLWIGFAQGCAIAPGISRSGATIATGLFRGLSGETAVRFSFLLSIPAILGALVFKIKDFQFVTSSLSFTQSLTGGITAAISGYFAIKIVFKSIRTRKFKFFALYCWILGIIGLLIR